MSSQEGGDGAWPAGARPSGVLLTVAWLAQGMSVGAQTTGSTVVGARLVGAWPAGVWPLGHGRRGRWDAAAKSYVRTNEGETCRIRRRRQRPPELGARRSPRPQVSGTTVVAGA